jgi:hypothetical protein
MGELHRLLQQAGFECCGVLPGLIALNDVPGSARFVKAASDYKFVIRVVNAQVTQ